LPKHEDVEVPPSGFQSCAVLNFETGLYVAIASSKSIPPKEVLCTNNGESAIRASVLRVMGYYIELVSCKSL